MEDDEDMEFTPTEQLDLGIVRRNLDDLAVARSNHGWSEMDRERYLKLCERERSLLHSANSR
jgi:hypothetical protein